MRRVCDRRRVEDKGCGNIKHSPAPFFSLLSTALVFHPLTHLSYCSERAPGSSLVSAMKIRFNYDAF